MLFIYSDDHLFSTSALFYIKTDDGVDIGAPTGGG